MHSVPRSNFGGTMNSTLNGTMNGPNGPYKHNTMPGYRPNGTLASYRPTSTFANTMATGSGYHERAEEDPHAYDYAVYAQTGSWSYPLHLVARALLTTLCLIEFILIIVTLAAPYAHLTQYVVMRDMTLLYEYRLFSIKETKIGGDFPKYTGVDMLPAQVLTVIGLILCLTATFLSAILFVCRISYESQRRKTDAERESTRLDYLDYLTRKEHQRQVEAEEQAALAALDSSDISLPSIVSSSDAEGSATLASRSAYGRTGGSHDNRSTASSEVFTARAPLAFYAFQERHRRRQDRNLGAVVLGCATVVLVTTIITVISLSSYYNSEIKAGNPEDLETSGFETGYNVSIAAFVLPLLVIIIVLIPPFSGILILDTPEEPTKTVFQVEEEKREKEEAAEEARQAAAAEAVALADMGLQKRFSVVPVTKECMSEGSGVGQRRKKKNKVVSDSIEASSVFPPAPPSVPPSAPPSVRASITPSAAVSAGRE